MVTTTAGLAVWSQLDGKTLRAVTTPGEEVLTALYWRERHSLIRLAALLVDDTAACEDIVQEAYIRVWRSWGRLREQDKALAYLRQTVVNLARSSLRRKIMAMRYTAIANIDAPSAEEGAWASLERDAVIAAIRALPRRQREAVVLRYYGDLREIDTAEVMGISVGAVKTHTSRGLAALAKSLEGLA